MSDHFREIKANKSLSKILFCIHANKIYDIFPAFTTREEKRLNGALLLLTPEQIDILHLADKHITIDYQKSIIAVPKQKTIYRRVNCYIIYFMIHGVLCLMKCKVAIRR